MKTILTLALSLGFFLLVGFTLPGDSEVDFDDRYHVIGKGRSSFYTLFQKGTDSGYFIYEEVARHLLPYFAGKPYGTGGRGCPSNKTLVNFDSYDCVTLVETWWALNYTLYEYKSRKQNHQDPFERFAQNLDKVRYFGGENCGIYDRIHYFTQAMQEMSRSGMMINVAVANGDLYKKRINYLSKEQGGEYTKEFLEKTKYLESMLSRTPVHYYPKEKVHLYCPMAKTGDIIAFASTVPGLDVSHCAILSRDEGDLMITHASSLKEKVVFEEDLREYIASRTTVSGIFVYRPIFE